MEFVQVRLLPNVVSSVPYVDRSRAADEGHPPSTGEIAGHSLLYNGRKPYHMGDGTIRFCSPSPSSAILTLHSRSAVISTIDHSKTSRSRRNERPTPPPMKNERHQPNNPTETRTILSRTQIAKLHSHLASNDSTGYRNPKSLSTAAAKIPRRSGSPKGSGEVLERDRGSKSPVSFQPPPRGVNKIYTYDVVFSIGEAKINDTRTTQIP